MKLKYIILPSLLTAGIVSTNAQNLQVTIQSGQGYVNDAVRIPVKVDDSTGIVGAAFLVTYDTDQLDVTVTSSFFKPIVLQMEEAGAFANGDPFVDFDVVENGSAIQTTLIPGTGMTIIANRILPSDGSNNALFDLYASRKSPQSIGVYDINIEPLTLSNVNAGYPPEGEEVDLLVGFVDDTITSRLEPGDLPGAVTPGMAEFLALLADDDNDHLPDPWELGYFDDLDQLMPGSDYDLDGLDDLLEYFLGLNPKVPDNPGVLSLEMENDDYAMYFPMRNIHGLDYLLEWSTNAVLWNSFSVVFTDRPDLDMGPDWTLVEAAFTVSENPDGTVLARLVVAPGD